MSDTTSNLEPSSDGESPGGRWPIDNTLRKSALSVIEHRLKDKNDPAALTAAKLAADIDSLNLRDEIELDKRGRLDAGLPTARLDSGPLGDAAQQLADELARLTGSEPKTRTVANEANDDLRLDGPEDG